MAVIAYLLPTQPTGALDGTVYYKYATAIAMRSRSYPVVPKTLTRNKSLNVVTLISVRWEQLTNTQRMGWGSYAHSTPLTNAWGQPKHIRGYAHFIRTNRPRILHGKPEILDPPTTPGLPAYTLPTITLAPDNSTVTVEPDDSDEWATEDGASMFLWISAPTSPARTFAPETYSPLGSIDGDSVSPPGSTDFLTTGLPTSPIRIWIRSAVARADGRYTSSS